MINTNKKLFYHNIKKKKNLSYLDFEFKGFNFLKKNSKKRRLKLFEQYYKNNFKDLFYLKKFIFSKFKYQKKKNNFRLKEFFFFNSFSRKLFLRKNNNKFYIFEKVIRKKINLSFFKFKRIFKYQKKKNNTKKSCFLRKKLNLKIEKLFFTKTKYFFKQYLKSFIKRKKKKKKIKANIREYYIKLQIKEYYQRLTRKYYSFKLRKKKKFIYRFIKESRKNNIFIRKILNKKYKSYLYAYKQIYLNIISNIFFNGTSKKKIKKLLKTQTEFKANAILESKLNIILLRTFLFESKDEINYFIKIGQIYLNKNKFTNHAKILKKNDIISFDLKLQKILFIRFLERFKNNKLFLNFPYYLTFNFRLFSIIYSLKDKNERKNNFYFKNFINIKSLKFFNKNRSMPC